MAASFTSQPGEAPPGTFAPGVIPAAGTGPAVITTTPSLIASAPASAGRGKRTGAVLGWLSITAASAGFYLGGPNVSASNGAAVTAPFTAPLFAGDRLYAATGAAPATLSILITGA